MAYDPNDYSEYDALKRRAQQRIGAQTQQQTDAIQRRFAAMGGLNSGAAIKTQQLAQQAGSEQQEQAMQDIEAQKRAEVRRRAEVQEGREFAAAEAEKQRGWQSGEAQTQRGWQSGEAGLQRQFATGERLGGQEFAGSQADMQRRFMTGERLGGQEFTGEQAALQRRFMTGERLGGQEFTAGQAEKQQTWATGEREAGQTFASDEAKKAFGRQEKYLDADMALKIAAQKIAEQQFQNDTIAQAFNMGVSTYQMPNKDDFSNWYKDGFLPQLGQQFPDLYKMVTGQGYVAPPPQNEVRPYDEWDDPKYLEYWKRKNGG